MLYVDPDSDTESDVDSATLDDEHVIAVTSHNVRAAQDDTVHAGAVRTASNGAAALPPKRPNTATRMLLVKHDPPDSREFIQPTAHSRC